MKFHKTIGIVGGAGPVASAFLYNTILEVCQKQYKANDYKDFPQIILVSYPFTRGDKERIREEISLCETKLKQAGASFWCIASNTFHGFLPEIDLPFVNLVFEGLRVAGNAGVTKALILAVQGTIDLKLYEGSSILCVYPSSEEQRLIQQIVKEVAGGHALPAQSEIIKRIISHYDVDGVILACTEIPIVHRSFPVNLSLSMPIIDTIEVLAEKLVDLAIDPLKKTPPGEEAQQ